MIVQKIFSKFVKKALQLIGGIAVATWAGSVVADVIDIAPSELEKLIESGVPVIDIRTPPEWRQTGIVAKSHPLTFFDERGAVDAERWLSNAKKLTQSADSVILICRSGNRTKAASQFLSRTGQYGRVYNVQGGIQRWMAESRATVPAGPLPGE